MLSFKSYASKIFLLSLALFFSACNKVDVSNRGELVFPDGISNVVFQEEYYEDAIDISEPIHNQEWNSSDYKSAEFNQNYALSGYRVIKNHKTRSSRPCSKARGFCKNINDIQYEKNFSVDQNENKKIYFARPIVIDGRLAVIDKYGVLSVYKMTNNDNLKLLWEFSLPRHLGEEMIGSYRASAVAQDGVIVVGLSNGCLVAINMTTGQEMWRYKMKGQMLAVPQIKYGVVYARTESGDIATFLLSSGSILSQANTADSTGDQMASFYTNQSASFMFGSNGYIYTGTNQGKMEIYTNDNLKLFDSYSVQDNTGYALFSDIAITPKLLPNGNVLTGTVYGGMGVFSPDKVDTVWKKNISLESEVAVMGDYAFFIDKGGNLIALNYLNGKLKWSQQLKTRIDSKIAMYLNKGESNYYYRVYNKGPYVCNNMLLVINSYGEVFGFDINKGTQIAEAELSDTIRDPVFIGDKIYVLNSSGDKILVIG